MRRIDRILKARKPSRVHQIALFVMIVFMVVFGIVCYLTPWYVEKMFADEKSPPPEVVAIIEAYEDERDAGLFFAVIDHIFEYYYDPQVLDRAKLLNAATLGMSRYLDEQGVNFYPRILVSDANLKDNFIAEMRAAKRLLKNNEEVIFLICVGVDALTESLGSSHTCISYPYMNFPYENRDGKKCGVWSIPMIGVAVTQREPGFLYISHLAAEYSRLAEGARLMKFDRIISIDGRNIKNFEDIGIVLADRDNEITKLVLERGGTVIEREVAISRRGYSPNILETTTIREDDLTLAHMNLNDFSQHAALGMLMSFPKDSQGLILDLRGNRGGLMSELKMVLEMFIPPDTLMYTTKGRGGPKEIRTDAQAKPLSLDLPLVILVDRHTVSAGEMLSAILKERGRATIIGERTSGKVAIGNTGSVIANWKHDWMIEITVTIAEFISAGGNSYEGVGVTPDIEALLTNEDILMGRDTQLTKAKEVLVKLIKEKK